MDENEKQLYVAMVPLLLIILTGCRTTNKQMEVGESIGIDLSQAEILSSSDTHGGFHGDGLELTVLQLQEDTENSFNSDSQGWHPLPLSENMQILLCGFPMDDGIQGPFLKDGSGNALLPEIRDGYYFFQDRIDNATDCYDDSLLFTRGAFNVTVAVYETETNRLYFLRFDT